MFWQKPSPSSEMIRKIAKIAIKSRPIATAPLGYKCLIRNLERECLQETTSIKIYIGSNPIVRRRGMSLTAGILGEEHVAGIKPRDCAVTESDIDVAGKRNDPAPARRLVKIYDVRSKIVAQQQSGCRSWRVEKLGLSARVQRLEIRLLVGSGE